MTFQFKYEKIHFTYGELGKQEEVVGVVEIVVGVESKARVARTLNLLDSKNTSFFFFQGAEILRRKLGEGVGGCGDSDHPLGSSIICNGTYNGFKVV